MNYHEKWNALCMSCLIASHVAHATLTTNVEEPK